MADDILSEFGNDVGPGQSAESMKMNRPEQPKDVMNYAYPKGPTSFLHEGPGLCNATNHGNKGSQHG